MKRRVILTLILMLTLSVASADVLVSTSCPDSVYVGELFTCIVTLYNDSANPVTVDYSCRFDKGRAIALVNDAGTLTIPALSREKLDVNSWAKDGGGEAFVFEYGYGTPDRGIFEAMMVVAPPIELKLGDVTVTAGKKNIIRTEVKGEAYFVKIDVDLPPSIFGTKHIEVGDVDGAVPIELELSPDPFAIGAHDVDVYIHFMDEKGSHTIRKRITVTVSPSYQALGFVVFAIGALLVVYFIVRRKKQSES